MSKILLFVLLQISIICTLSGQKPKIYTSAEIYHAVEKLNFLGTALYMAAHPDDENTRLISYLSNDLKARTAYMSLTRGDGGQNLIGTEIQELLGVLRTQELQMARSVDGGQQFFSRAIDFGYSKHPDETLAIWNKDEVLADVVRVIRKFKPDIIVNRFDHRTPGKTHGHHTSSAMLSYEAFDLVGSKSAYPEQFEEGIEAWSPQRLFFNTSWWFYGSREKFAEADKSNLMSMDIGAYYPLLGKSNTEIAAEARSKHACQGFGSAGTRGSYTEYLELLKGDMPEIKTDPFQGINTTWSRVKGGEAIGAMVDELLASFNFRSPGENMDKLVQIYNKIKGLPDGHWKAIKLEEIKDIIAACSGLYLEASANAHRVVVGDSIEVKIEAVNRSSVPMTLKSVVLNSGDKLEMSDQALDNNITVEEYLEFVIPNTAANSSHYWLKNKGTMGMFAVKDKDMIGKPETPRSFSADYVIDIMGTEITFNKDVVYRFTNPSKGLLYKPFELTDPVFVSIEEEVIIFPGNAMQEVEVTVQAGTNDVAGSLNLGAPKGWNVSPASANFDISTKDGIQKITFKVTPPSGQSIGSLKPVATYQGRKYSNDLIEIEYDHIPAQSVLRPEEAKVAKINIETAGKKIAYIMGAGDKVPECLRYVGYQVEELTLSAAEPQVLANYDAVVLGIRALNTLEDIDVYQDNLMTYVEAGGTFITQYNTSRRLKTKDFGPYPMSLGRFRVSQEDAEMRIVNPDHKVLNFPNKITEDDFDNWIQERGLYFASEWDDNYETVISCNDKGEDPSEGGMLIAEYGKGHFVYSNFSWFRQLPAGVPGAYRIFANMLALSAEE